MPTTITALQAVKDALARHIANGGDKRPKRVFVGPHAYELLHAEAAENGCDAPMHPQREEQRLECAGMKLHCKDDNAITFE